MWWPATRSTRSTEPLGKIGRRLTEIVCVGWIERQDINGVVLSCDTQGLNGNWIREVLGEGKGAYGVVAKSRRKIIDWIHHDAWFLMEKKIITVLRTWELIR